MPNEPRILAVSLATALDRYLWLDALTTGAVNRPTRVVEAAGGKSLNFARAATAIGLDVAVVALIGGPAGEAVVAAGAGEAWSASWVRAEASTRICTCVLDEHTGALTELYEPLAPVPASTWSDLRAAIDRARDERPPDALVLSGRQPAGLPEDAYTTLASYGRAATRPQVWVDTTGASLRAALAAHPFVVKVNAAEAAELVGHPVHDVPSAQRAATALAGQTDEGAAAVTLGADGAVLVAADTVHIAAVPALRRALPVGSGDSFLAGLIAGWYRTADWRSALVEAAACSVANATRLEAGRLDPSTVARLRDEVRVTTVEPEVSRPSGALRRGRR